MPERPVTWRPEPDSRSRETEQSEIERRAARAKTALDAYALQYESDTASLQEIATDFVTDLRHLIDGDSRIEWEDVLSTVDFAALLVGSCAQGILIGAAARKLQERRGDSA